MSDGFIGLWRATYLLPYPENALAKADRRHAMLYRHTTLVSADDPASVVRELKRRGAMAIEVTKAPLPHPLFRRVKRGYKTAFIQALLFAVEGGLSPGRALENLILSETGTMRTRFNIGLDLLQSGRPFIEAMRSLDMFDGATLAIIDAGEQAGKLKNALASAIAHMSKADDSFKLMFGAVSATALDIVLAASAIVGIRFAMLPKIREDGPGAGATPEQAAEFETVLRLAEVGNEVLLGFTIVLIVAMAWGAFAYFGRSDTRRDTIDRMLMKLPMIGALYAHSSVSATTAIMANLLRGGVHFIPATLITQRGSRIPSIRRYWQRACRMTESGESISKAMASEPMSQIEQMVLSSHTNSQQLATALEEISKSRTAESKSAAKKFGLIVFVGSMIYSGLAVLLALAAVWAQSTAAMSGPGG